jgi:hypothetical protein
MDQRDEHADRQNSTDNGEPRGQAPPEGEDGADALLSEQEQDRFRQRWSDIQTSFIDQPQRSVEEANALVADLTDRLVSSFRDEQTELEGHWTRNEEVSTEELRTTLRRYRSFFGRLLEV